jgi:hypothetical protein
MRERGAAIQSCRQEREVTQVQTELEPIVSAPEIEALFVQTAERMNYSDGVLTLDHITPTTLFFSDRPDRVTGHITTEEFVDSWGQGKNSFADDPPNAVLSIFHPDEVQDVVVVLKEPVMAIGEIAYRVEILDGEMPSEGGPSALFIDVIGRPLTPMSLAGMRRREGRRMARRVGRR